MSATLALESHSPVTATRRLNGWTLSLIVFSVVGLALFAYITPYGTALANSDTVIYYVAAQSLVQGEGYRLPDGEPYTRWPPLFPTLIAIPMALGVEGTDSVRLVNGVAHAALVLAAGSLFFRLLRSPVLALLASATVAISWQQAKIAYFGFSETVFSLLVALVLIALLHYQARATARAAILLGGCVALACLQRYVGVALLGGVGLVMLISPARLPLGARLRHAALTGGVALLPLGLWFARNAALTGSIVGSDWETTTNHLERAPGLLLEFLWPTQTLQLERPEHGVVVTLGIALAVAVAAIMAARVRDKDAPPQTPVDSPFLAVSLVIVTSLVFYIGMVYMVRVDVTARMFTPLQVPMLLLACAVVDGIIALASRRVAPRIVTAVAVVLIFGWLAEPTDRMLQEAAVLSRSDEPMGSNNLAWRQSDLVQWLQSHPLDGHVITNAQSVVAAFSGRPAASIDPDLDTVAAAPLPADRATYFVWVYDVREKGCIHRFASCRNVDFTLDALRDRFRVEAVFEAADGGVYRLSPRAAT